MQKSVCGHNSVCLCMFVCVRKKIYIYISVYVTSKQVCLVVLVLTYVILVGGASSLWASDLGKATMGRAFRFGFMVVRGPRKDFSDIVARICVANFAEIQLSYCEQLLQGPACCLLTCNDTESASSQIYSAPPSEIQLQFHILQIPSSCAGLKPSFIHFAGWPSPSPKNNETRQSLAEVLVLIHLQVQSLRSRVGC